MLVIQNTIQKLSSPLSHIINLSLFSGIVPDQLKVSRVIPLFKLLYEKPFKDFAILCLKILCVYIYSLVNVFFVSKYYNNYLSKLNQKAIR